MAINKVVAPNSVPTNVSDYVAQNAHMMGFMTQVNMQAFVLTDPTTADKPKVALGSYIAHGGSLYKVEGGDETISGSPADGKVYVRVTGNATLSASFISDISGYSYNHAYGTMTSGAYTLLPYVVIKAGNSWLKYRYDAVQKLQAETLNTGQGDNLLYPMNQAVRETDSVKFENISLKNKPLGFSYSTTPAFSFNSPSGDPRGLAFDGTNLISCDLTAKRVYIHDGKSDTILSSFEVTSLGPRSITFDGTNLISCGESGSTRKIYVHNGVSASVLTSFDSPGSFPSGLAFDGTNLISCDSLNSNITIHNGVSSNVLASFRFPYYAEGITFDGVNLIVSSLSRDRIYILEGKSNNILRSFDTPGGAPRGLAFDGTHLISCDSISDKIYFHEPFVTHLA
jgi:DNA-binding beta-propeller fold protein YncE